MKLHSYHKRYDYHQPGVREGRAQQARLAKLKIFLLLLLGLGAVAYLIYLSVIK